MNIAPIVLFVYNRPNLVDKVVKNLKKNTLSKSSELYIFSDGPKKNKNDILKIKKVRTYLRKIKGFKKINIIVRKKNLGLYQNITSGLNFIFNKRNSAIILEDDILVSKNFLTYMNESLNVYKDDNKVGSICANLSSLNSKMPETFFLYHQDCWGWATWKRSWKLYSHDSSYLLNKIVENKLVKKFDLDNSYKFSKYLRENILKRRSWATNWYASLFIKKKLNLFPGSQMCKNIGFGKASTNSKLKFETVELSKKKIKVNKINFEESIIGYKEIVRYYLKITKEVKIKYYKSKIFEKIKKYF